MTEAQEPRHIWVMAKGYAPDEGGMQSYAQGVAEAYAATGARITVFGQSAAGPRRERVGPVFLIDIGSGKSASVPLRLMQAMRQQLRRQGPPAFVHGTTWRTSLLPMLLGFPFVTTFHGREFMSGGLPARWLMRRVVRTAKLVVAVSPYSAGRLQQRLGGDIAAPLVLWNGLSVAAPIEQDATQPQPGRPPIILSLCRLEPRKNIAACVRACAELRDAGLDFRYIIGGRGPELSGIRALVDELALGRMVKVVGRVPRHRLRTLYGMADIFLHPQIAVDDDRDFEGFGITIADAMAHGTALIAGKAGGPGDIIDSGVTGLLVDGSDDAEIVVALQQLIEDGTLRQRLGHKAREHASSNFQWSRHVAGILHRLGFDKANGSAEI